MIEVAFLNGNESPTIETAEADFNVLCVQMRGYHDFGVALQDPSAARVTNLRFAWKRGKVAGTAPTPLVKGADMERIVRGIPVAGGHILADPGSVNKPASNPMSIDGYGIPVCRIQGSD